MAWRCACCGGVHVTINLGGYREEGKCDIVVHICVWRCAYGVEVCICCRVCTCGVEVCICGVEAVP